MTVYEEETLRVVVDTQFPVEGLEFVDPPVSSVCEEDWYVATSVVTRKCIDWVLGSFSHFMNWCPSLADGFGRDAS